VNLNQKPCLELRTLNFGSRGHQLYFPNAETRALIRDAIRHCRSDRQFCGCGLPGTNQVVVVGILMVGRCFRRKSMINSRFSSAFLAGIVLVFAVAGSVSVSGQEPGRDISPCVPGDPQDVREIRRTPRAEVELDQLGGKVYKINANESWRRTDVEVRRGQRVEITAGGIARWASDGAAWTIVNANGREGASSNFLPFPGAPIGSLVMRIGKGVYPAGASVVVEAEDDGVIEFMINDDILSDNSGSFQVRVNVRPD
jgi:hypothetical protein